MSKDPKSSTKSAPLIDFEKIRDDFNRFFGITPRNSPSESVSTNPTQTFQESWNDFLQATRKGFQDMREELDANLALAKEKEKARQLDRQVRLQERQKESQAFWLQAQQRQHDRWKKRQERRLARLSRREHILQSDFDRQQEELEKKMKKMETQLTNNTSENKQSFLENLHSLQLDWERNAVVRQKKFERFLGAVNRISWRFQIRIILILVPILILVAVVFYLLRPFISV